MPDARELRRGAALCRRMASIPTAGGHRADRILVQLAQKLEHAAREAEQAQLARGDDAATPDKRVLAAPAPQTERAAAG